MASSKASDNFIFKQEGVVLRYLKGLITLVLFLAPGTMFAQSALDGTWRIDPHSMQYVGTETFSLQSPLSDGGK